MAILLLFERVASILNRRKFWVLLEMNKIQISRRSLYDFFSTTDVQNRIKRDDTVYVNEEIL